MRSSADRRLLCVGGPSTAPPTDRAGRAPRLRADDLAYRSVLFSLTLTHLHPYVTRKHHYIQRHPPTHRPQHNTIYNITHPLPCLV